VPWWAVVAGVLLCLSLLAMLSARMPQRPANHGSYDAGDSGTRAAYLLLEAMGIPVSQSKRMAEGNVRWLLFPLADPKEIEVLKDWIQAGGVLLLADPGSEFTRSLGVEVQDGADAKDFIELKMGENSFRVEVSNKHIELKNRSGRGWPPNDGEPFVSIITRGRGEIWLLHYPNFVKNSILLRGVQKANENAQVLYRLAQAIREEHPETIYVDEYYHGMRERPTVTDLLLKPPVLWTSLHGLVLLLLVLWAFSPRFGRLLELPPARRRSKEEFLDALANILDKKHAYDYASKTVRDAFVRDLARDLGLPASATTELVIQQAQLRRKKVAPERLRRGLLPHHPVNDATIFLATLHELDNLRHACFAR